MKRLHIKIIIFMTVFFIIYSLQTLYSGRRFSPEPEYFKQLREFHLGKLRTIENRETPDQIEIPLERAGNRYDVESFAKKRGYKDFKEFLCTENPRIWKIIKYITYKKGYEPGRIIRYTHFYPSRNLKYCLLTETYLAVSSIGSKSGRGTGVLAGKIELINEKGEILWQKKNSIINYAEEFKKFHPLIQNFVQQSEINNWNDNNWGISQRSVFYYFQLVWVSDDGDRIITLQTKFPDAVPTRGRSKIVVYNKKGRILFQIMNVDTFKVNRKKDLIMVGFFPEKEQLGLNEIALYNIKGEEIFRYKAASDERIYLGHFDKDDIFWGGWEKVNKRKDVIDVGLYKLNPKEKKLKKTQDEKIMKKRAPRTLKYLKELRSKRKK